MKFDDILTRHVGELGRFQLIVVCILGFEELFISLQVMAPLFLAANPQTLRCRNSDLESQHTFQNCSWEQQIALTSPRKGILKASGQSGESFPQNGTGIDTEFDHCRRYDYNVTSLPQDFLETACRQGELLDTDGVERSKSRSDLDVNVSRTLPCSEWEYGSDQRGSTIVTEWHLLCDITWKAKTVASVFLGGRAVGNFVFGWMADRFGRRKVLLGAGLTNVALGVVTAFSPNLVFLLVVRFFHAMFATGKTNAGFVMAMEYSGPSKRVSVSCYYFICWGLGYMCLAGVAYLVPDWRWLMLAITVPEVINYALFFFFVPESPRWLYLQARNEEADKTVHKMDRINGRILPKDIKISERVAQQSSSPWDLVRKPELRAVTLIMLFVWTTCGFVYYGLSFASPPLGVNAYLSCLIAGGSRCLPTFSPPWSSTQRDGSRPSAGLCCSPASYSSSHWPFLRSAPGFYWLCVWLSTTPRPQLCCSAVCLWLQDCFSCMYRKPKGPHSFRR